MAYKDKVYQLNLPTRNARDEYGRLYRHASAITQLMWVYKQGWKQVSGRDDPQDMCKGWIPSDEDNR